MERAYNSGIFQPENSCRIFDVTWFENATQVLLLCLFLELQSFLRCSLKQSANYFVCFRASVCSSRLRLMSRSMLMTTVLLTSLMALSRFPAKVISTSEAQHVGVDPISAMFWVTASASVVAFGKTNTMNTADFLIYISLEFR